MMGKLTARDSRWLARNQPTGMEQSQTNQEVQAETGERLTHGNAPHDARQDAGQDDSGVDPGPVPHHQTVEKEIQRAGQHNPTVVAKQVVDICEGVMV